MVGAQPVVQRNALFQINYINHIILYYIISVSKVSAA